LKTVSASFPRETARVLATDISAGILALAQRRFDQAGLANAATRVMDGEDLAVEEGHYDAVISRLGLIYLPDRAGARGSALRALRIRLAGWRGEDCC
jgi:ubiquinone/menaquinone biosynthesis C-methylase UbiE